MAEIYALIDPRDNSLRYIGKANCSRKRLASHQRDMIKRDTPVYRWMRKLRGLDLKPRVEVLVVCEDSEWKVAEKSAIIQARALGAKLLNVAEGGDEPHCPTEVRAANGRANAIARTSTPEKAEVYRLKRLFGQMLKRGEVTEVNKKKLRYAARRAPHLFGCFARV